MENNKRQITVAIALIQNAEGKIFLQKRLDPLIPEAHEKWEFPGGRVDYGESSEETVKRECLEEIGCEIRIKKLMPLIQSAVWIRTDDKEQHVLVICYQAELISGDPKPFLDKKVGDVKWFSKEEINELDVLRGIREYVELLDK
jgi:mutator protein MutT